MAINREKEAAVLRWLSCYDIKVRSISDLQDGLQLLKLLSTINQTCSIENVEPGKAFPHIEKQLCEYHSCLPAHFLSSGIARKQRYNDIQLATTSVLALSALALRTTSCGPTSNVAPLLKLDEATQCCIRDLIEIVSAGDDVIDNLVAYLKASAVEEESFLCVSKVKRRKSENFTASPTEAKTPAKRSSMSPQQRASLPAHQLKEMHMLREHITDEEQANIELRRERSKLTEVVKRKDREISKLKERLQALQSLSFSDATSIAKLNKNVEETSAQNKLLQEQVHSLEKVREDYDKVIRQNVSLQAECEKITKLQEECNNLKEHLSMALSEKSDLRARLASVEESAGELRHELDAKTQELDSLVSFYSDKEKPVLNSPKAQLSPPGGRVSCYMELRMVDLEEANKKLREKSCRLQNEIEGVTAKLQAENNAIRASVVQLEEAKEALTQETLQLKNRCTKLTTRISGLENELQLSKTTNAKLESQLSIQVSQSETLHQQLADKDQQIATLEEKSTASDSMNQELLKSNGELNAALRSSEVEKVSQAERMREVVAENRKYQDALSQQKSKVLTLTTTLENLEVKLAEVVARSESLSSQLSASEEQRAKLEQQIATLCSELEESQSRCRDLEHQLSQARCEKEAQATRLLDVQGELSSVKCTADHLRVRVQELEASKQQLDALCFELQKKLSERECQLSVAAERNEALLKIKEEVLAAEASLRAQFAEESEQHSMLRTSLQNRLQESEALAARLQEEKQGLAEKSIKLEAEVELLRSELSKLQEKNTALSNELSEIARSREELNNNLRSQNGQLEKVASECNRLQQCVEESEAERAALEARLEKEAEVICALEKKCEEQAALSENLHRDNVALKSSQEEVNIKIQHLEASITDANNKNLSLQKDLGDARQKLEDVLAECKTLEAKLSEKSSSCSTLQAELSKVKEKLRASENQEHILRNANAGLDSFVSECQQKLQQSESRLQDATRQIGPLREQVAFFQQIVGRLNLEKEFLHSSLATAEVTLQSLEVKFQASTTEVDEMRSKFKESQHRQTQLSSLVEQLQEECKSLKMVLADMGEKLSCCEKELSSAAIERDNVASQLKEFECENARLKHENQALEDYVGNLEVKLNNQLELHKKGEEDYYECVKERDAHKEALRQQIDELTAKVAEKEKLQDQLQELQRQFEEYKTSAAGNNGNLSKENERLELELASLQRELQSAIAKHDELSREVKALQKENEGLKHEAKGRITRFCLLISSHARVLHNRPNEMKAVKKKLEELHPNLIDCKNEDGSKNMQAALASFSAVMDSAKQEVHIWKEKCQKQQAYREQREKLLKQHVAELSENIKKTSQDTEALKTQTERQAAQLTAATEERDKLASELAAMKKERDKLATERRSLEAQLSYCDAKLREYSKEAKKASGKAVNQSLYSTPSLESVWSQRQPSRRQSNTSIASVDEFKVPHFKGNLRRESSSRSGKLTQAAAALDSSIFSESRFSCDEEQGLFSETALADLSSLPDDPMGRYSELYRRNSMLPQHLRSVYPVETQQCPIPATPLRGGDSMFPFSEASSPAAAAAAAAAAATPAAPSRQHQPSSTTDDTTKRKRDTRSSSSNDSSGKSSFWANVGTPSRSTKPNKSTRTPSSVKKFLRSKFKR